MNFFLTTFHLITRKEEDFSLKSFLCQLEENISALRKALIRKLIGIFRNFMVELLQACLCRDSANFFITHFTKKVNHLE